MHPYTLSLLDSIPLPDPLYEQRRQASKRYNPQAAHDYSKELPTLTQTFNNLDDSNGDPITREIPGSSLKDF